MANLLLAMLHKIGAPIDSIGDTTEPLEIWHPVPSLAKPRSSRQLPAPCDKRAGLSHT
jgi:hypothetical protein